MRCGKITAGLLVGALSVLPGEPLLVTAEQEQQLIEELAQAQERFWQNNPGWFHSPDEVPFENRPLEVVREIRQEQARAKAEARAKEAARKEALGAGIPLLQQRDAEGAYAYYSRLIREDYDDPRANFYLGMAAMELRRFDEAISAFERVLIIDSSHRRARLEMARCYYYQRNLDTAEEHFLRVLDEGVPQRVQIHVRRYLALIEEARKRHHTGVMLYLGVAYDTNVRNDIGSGEHRVAPGVALGYAQGISGEDPKADSAHQQMVRFSHTYDFGRLGGWAWQSHLSGFAQNQMDESERSIRLFSLATGPVYRAPSRHSWSIQTGFDRVVVGGDAYLDEVLLRLGHMRPLAQDRVLEMGYLLAQKSYQRPVYQGRDGQRHELFAGMRFFLPDHHLYFVRGALGLDQADEESDRRTLSLTGGYTHQLSATLSTTLSAGYRYQQNSESGADLDRVGQSVQLTDQQLTFNLSSAWLRTRSNQFNASYSYIDNDSNQNFNQWDKHLLTLNGVWFFSF